MAVRTTTTLVQALLDAGLAYNGTSDLTPFIDTANKIVNRVAVCATSRGKTLTIDELELIERWLAAHCYAMSDQPYASQNTGRASGSYQGKTAMHLDATKYGQMALVLDYSGCLGAISSGHDANVTWAGKRIPTPWDMRG